MEFLNKIRDFVQDLEEKDFYKYLGIMLLILVILMSFMIYRYYSNVNYYTDEIETINEQRETEVKKILERNEIVKKQRKEVDEMLKQDEDFKIRDYFDKLLKDLKLTRYKKDDNVLEQVIDENYEGRELTARLEDIDMKQLCELLEKLEAKKRINIKSLEIRKSKKRGAIDVDIIISTLLPKARETT